MTISDLTTRFLFFTGKCGVGKTSLACAVAVELAERGKRTLIVSTDPASNLDEVFGVSLAPEPTEIPAVPGLRGMNLDPEAAARAYREKMVAPYRGMLPEAVLRSMEEQFSGACTTEIAAFDEFVRLMSDAKVEDEFDAVVFDTAPTGHTLRLLSLPHAWSGYLNTTTAETTCLGPLSGLQEQKAVYETALRRLADAGETTVCLVARPDASSLKEAARTQGELGALGVRNQVLFLNAVYRGGDAGDPVSLAFAEIVTQSLAGMPSALADLPRIEIPMLTAHVVGLDALRTLLHPERQDGAETVGTGEFAVPEGMSLKEMVDGIQDAGHGVVLTMGKGGVGKTTAAILIAQELAARGERVTLTTTDPAGNVMDLVRETPETLTVRRIDPAEEVRRYTEAAMARAAGTMDEDALALLAEDLRSPCTEEIAVFRAFAEVVAEGADHFVVIDTAPTGHTILLMDASEAYHREVTRTNSDAPESVRQLLPRLRDPQFTRVILVTLPEPTPVHEAMALEGDLERAGMGVYGWIVNRSFAVAGVREAALAAKAGREAGPIREVLARGSRCVLLGWMRGGGLG